MSITVRCEQNYRTEINIRQHTVLADEHIDDGGDDSAPTPMEILTGTLGACIAVTTRAYAMNKGWALDAISVDVDLQRFKGEDYLEYSGEAPYVYEAREVIRFEGALTDEQKARLMTVAAKCPVHRVLESPVFFVDKLIESEAQS